MASSDCSKPPSTQSVPFKSKGMDDISHVLDPDGDVIIVLEKSTENRPTDASSNDSPDNEPKEEDPEEKPQGIRIRVSSKHLALASPYFKRMLGPNWEEGKSLRATGTTSITATDFDLDALLVVLNAMHGRQDHLPRKLSLEMLANVAVVVDYYQCHGVVDMAKELWINNLKPSFPTTYTGNATLWIWVAWVFSAAEEVESATTLAIRQCPGPFSPLGFPIPSVVINELNKKIEAAIDSIHTSLDRLLIRFRDEGTACSFNCNVMLFGLLSFAMHKRRLIKDSGTLMVRATSIYCHSRRKTFQNMIEALREIESEEPRVPRLHDSYESSKSRCGLRGYINSLIDDVEGKIAGLSLSAFQ